MSAQLAHDTLELEVFEVSPRMMASTACRRLGLFFYRDLRNGDFQPPSLSKSKRGISFPFSVFQLPCVLI
jgi:hypothetical protein